MTVPEEDTLLISRRLRRKLKFWSLIVAASISVITAPSLAQRERLGEYDPLARQEAREERERKEALARAAAEEKRKQAEAEAAEKAKQQRLVNEKIKSDQEKAAKALLVALQREATTKTSLRAAERLVKQAELARNQAFTERELANDRSRKLAQKEFELKESQARLNFAREQLVSAEEELGSANKELEWAKKEHRLKELILEVWRAVLSISVLGLLMSNLFTFLNMRHDRQRATSQDRLTNLQIEEMELKLKQLRSGTSPADSNSKVIGRGNAQEA